MTLLLVGLAISFGAGWMQQRMGLLGKLTFKRRLQLFLATLVGFYFISYVVPSLVALVISLLASFAGQQTALKGAGQRSVQLGRPLKASTRRISSSLKGVVKSTRQNRTSAALQIEESRFSNLR